MRVAIVNQYGHVAGGTERYLRDLVPALQERGAQVAFFYERQIPPGAECLHPPGTATEGYCMEQTGLDTILSALRQWRPDVVFDHGTAEIRLSEALPAVAPVVCFVHTYQGTCISGFKARRYPSEVTCARVFGPACLLHYLPSGCGGRNPLTMIREYDIQSRRLAHLKRAARVVTASQHMRAECIHNGLDSDQVVVAGLVLADCAEIDGEPRCPIAGGELHLLFSGRLTRLKGGHLLLGSLPEIAAKTGLRVMATFAGDGPERTRCIRLAQSAMQHCPLVKVAFRGWLTQQECRDLYRQAHVLIMPSVWPEPFGLSGPEAAQYGVPAVAFAVGGIPEWLIDGVNGHLAADLTTQSLAAAVIACLKGPEHYAELRLGATRLSRSFTREAHMSRLWPLLESAALQGRV